jgi:hypothetical protein
MFQTTNQLQTSPVFVGLSHLQLDERQNEDQDAVLNDLNCIREGCWNEKKGRHVNIYTLDI